MSGYQPLKTIVLVVQKDGTVYWNGVGPEDFQMVKALMEKDILISRYGFGGGLFDRDTYSGLTLAIHGWTGVDIEIENYHVEGKEYKGRLKYTFTDNFGLDSYDLDPYGALAGFRAWYILQHSKEYDGKYQPFVTEVEIYQDFSGVLD